MVALVCAETGLTCRVVTATGRAVVRGPRALPPEDLDRVIRAFLTADRLPAVVGADAAGSGAPYSVFPVGPALGQRMTSWFVVVEGIWSTWEPDVADAVGQLAVIAALDRARRDEGLRASRHIADEAVGLVERGAGGQPETQVRLRQAGVSGDARLAVAVAEFPGRPDLAEVSRSVLDDAAAQLGAPVVGTTGDGRAVALLCTADPAFADVLRTGLARLAPALGQARLTVGISEPSDPAALSGALEEARHARRLAELRHRPGERRDRAWRSRRTSCCWPRCRTTCAARSPPASWDRCWSTTRATVPGCARRSRRSWTAPARGAARPRRCTCTSTRCGTGSPAWRS